MADQVNRSRMVADREAKARVFAALADPHRLGIVELVSGQDLSPDALAHALGIQANLLAHHLKVLEDAGLIRRTHSHSDRRRTYVQGVSEAWEGLLPGAPRYRAARVVFVCTHNSARSVLADAVWRSVSPVPSTSAGTHPASEINPSAVRVAARHGISIAQRRPQHLASVLRSGDLVVSVCDAVNEQLGPMANTHLHWSIPDPAAVGGATAFSRAVEEIQDRVAQLAPHVSRARATAGRSRGSGRGAAV